MKLAIVQIDMTDVLDENVDKCISQIKIAAKNGAQTILLPELFEGFYFPQVEREEHFSRAHPIEKHPFIERFQKLAAALEVVIPLSFFEASGQAHYNSLVMIDADGSNLGVYRKSHIPDGPGYEEKYYFNQGDTGFRAFHTKYGCIGIGICWDQWYPECARCLTLLGADLLLYPTAIGSEPAEAGEIDTHLMWERVMIGHAVANSTYVAAANRIGTEKIEDKIQTFYGNSFISDYAGNFLSKAGENEETILYADLHFAKAKSFRAGMGFFRDRRPELYKPLLTSDGVVKRAD